jgi:hypothetical protein
MQLTIRIAELPRYGGALILFRAVLSRRAQVAPARISRRQLLLHPRRINVSSTTPDQGRKQRKAPSRCHELSARRCCRAATSVAIFSRRRSANRSTLFMSYSRTSTCSSCFCSRSRCSGPGSWTPWPNRINMECRWHHSGIGRCPSAFSFGMPGRVETGGQPMIVANATREDRQSAALTHRPITP